MQKFWFEGKWVKRWEENPQTEIYIARLKDIWLFIMRNENTISFYSKQTTIKIKSMKKIMSFHPISP